MVQGVLNNIITAYQDRPFEHLFLTDKDADREHIYQAVAPDYELVLSSGEASFTLTDGEGLTVAMNNAGKAIIVASIYDMSRIPVGGYTYTITANDLEGVAILNESGVLNVFSHAPEDAPVMNHSVKPWDLFNPAMARSSAEVRAERLGICHECPNLVLGFCKECGCRMKWKVTLSDAECPIGLWGRVESASDATSLTADSSG